MKRFISVLLCLTLLTVSVFSGAVVVSAEGTYTGTIENYVSDIEREASPQNKAESGSGTVEFNGNMAQGRPTTVSGVEPNMNNLTGDKAVDGVCDINDANDHRWSSNHMKGDAVVNGQHTPAWIVIDLGAKPTDVTDIVLNCYKLVWPTEMQIQTAADYNHNNESATTWQTVYTLNRESGNTQNPVITIDFDSQNVEFERYVRFYATHLNDTAGGVSLSFCEIEINGTIQRPAGDAPATASAAMAAVSALTLNSDESNVVFPQMTGNYEFSIKGSDVDGIIAADGSVSPYVIGNHDVTVLAQIVNSENESDRAEKNFTIHVSDKSDDFELFPEVAHPNDRPGVIPAVQEWYGYEGYYTPSLQKDIKFVYDVPTDLADDAQAAVQKIADALLAITYIGKPTIEAGTSADGAEIYFKLLDEPKKDKYFIGDEGNIVIVNDNGVQIYANTVKGLLFGGYTLAQGLLTGDGQFPKGVVRDYPKFEIRGVMLDVARSPFRLETLEEYQDIFSWFKLNEMHMHINDARHQTNQSRPNYSDWQNVEGFFRLQSETFPGLTSTAKDSEYFNADDGYGGTVQYSKEEWKKFQQRGLDLGLNMITEIDLPGHALQFTKYVHEALEGLCDDAEARKTALREVGVTGEINRASTWEHVAMDTNTTEYQNAMKFIEALYNEYLDENDPVFLGDTVQIGAEEYWNINENEKRGLKNYIDKAKEIIEGAGKKVRMWGNITNYLTGVLDSTDEYANDIILDIWSPTYENARDRIADGYKIVNENDNYLYNNALRDRRDVVNVEYLYKSWTPYQFNGYLAPTGEPGVVGAKTAVWQDITDMGVTETDNTERIIRAAAIIAEKTWGGTGNQSFTDYSLLFSKLRYGPKNYDAYAESYYNPLYLNFKYYDKDTNKFDGDEDVTVTGNIATETDDNGKVWGVFNGNQKITTNIVSLTYPYTISFDIQKGSNTGEVKLFASKDGWLTLTADGKLKIYRAFFKQEIYTLPNQAVNITLVGTQEALKLYVDGEFVKIFNRKSDSETDYNNLSTTFDLPLQNIADGFVGKLADIKVYTKALSPEVIRQIFNGEMVDYVNVAQNRGVGGDAQHAGDTDWDNANKKLRVAWKAVDGDGNAIDDSHGVDKSEKDSFFAGQQADSSLTVDLWRTQKISKITLQWDNPPANYKLQTSDDGKTWEDLETVTDNQNVHTLYLETPLETRYLRMQGVLKNGNGNFQLREFMAFEKIEREKFRWAASSFSRYMSSDEKNSEAIYLNNRYADLTVSNPLVERNEVDAYISAAETAVEERYELTQGDANFDGALNIKDATAIQKYAAGIISYEKLDYFTSDVNGDGEVTGADTTAIQKYLVGITKTLSK